MTQGMSARDTADGLDAAVVCTPHDALECFYTSPIDVLAIGGTC